MNYERLNPVNVDHHEARLLDFALLRQWENDLPYFKESLGKLRGQDDLIDYLKKANYRRTRALRRADRRLQDPWSEVDITVGESFDTFKDAWTEAKDRAMLLAIILRAQGANWVRISMRDETPGETQINSQRGENQANES